jgi:hemerythrin
MADQGIDPRHQEAHTQHHRQFVEQVVSIWQAKASIEHPAQVIHEFLAGWLTVHILGEDR